MGQVIELHRYKQTARIVPEGAPREASHLLPFLWWRSASALWLSLWLAPLGLRVIDARDPRAAARRSSAA